MTYAFYFDSSSCSGCKACQVACQDKNNLPLGVRWRRVYEVSGGEWTNVRAGGLLPVWENTIFAYNLSIACNHCVHPKCAGVCPVNAYEVRPDGIVLINTRKCIGCGYCAWACPYDAPQIDRSAGVMTKCNLCYDNLDAGLPPACVAACPLRCLELVEINEPGIEEKGIELWEVPGAGHPFPLPKLSRTRPHLLLKPHPAEKLVGETARVSNREEISSVMPHTTASGEIPLIFFTLLAQMAIGAFITLLIIYGSLSDKLVAGRITFIPLLGAGISITAALLVSFFHLGTPKNAWRVLSHLRKSWLSREILFTSGFAGLWAILTGLRLFRIGSNSLWTGLAALTALCGLAALYSMQRVYQFRNIPGWNKGRTLLEFVVTSMGLGGLLTGSLLPRAIPASLLSWIGLACIPAFLIAIQVSISVANSKNRQLTRWRVGLLLAGVLCALALSIWPSSVGMGLTWLVFLIAMTEEALGRWLFYSRRNPGI